MRRMGVGLLVALAAGGCSKNRTEVMIGVATDLAAPDQLDAVKLEIYRDGVLAFDIPPWPVPGKTGGEYVLPASFGVYTDDGSEPRIEVQVHGIKNNANIINRRAVFALIAEQTLFFRMALVLRCMGNDCGQGQSCIEGECRPEEVDSHKFPVYTAGLENDVTCQGADTLRNTQTGAPLMSLGSGACPPSQHCTESTCYDNKLKISPFCAPPGFICTGVEQYEDCFFAMCDATVKPCFGPNWQNGQFQGPCAGFGNCYIGCNCDSNCLNGCDQMFMGAGSACASCLGNSSMGPLPCEMACPQPSCMTVGAIVGSAYTKRELVAADGSVSVNHEPIDLTQHQVEAIVGGQTIPALTHTDGSFEIDGVPIGATWMLHYDTYYLVTAERSLDLSTYVTGRADLVSATTSPTNMTFNLSSLSSWQASDYVEVYSGNAGGLYTDTNGYVPAPAVGATTASFTLDWVMSAFPPTLIKSSEGDILSFLQLNSITQGSLTYTAVSSVGTGMADMMDGQTTTLNITMASVPQSQAVLSTWKRSIFSQLRSQMNPMLQNPSAGPAESYSIEAQPGGLDHGQIAGLPCVMALFPPVGTSDINLGTLMFGNPFPPAWGLFATVRETGQVQYALPGTTQPANIGASVSVDADLPTLASGPVAPMVGPVGSPKINGQDAFGNLSGVGPTPTLTWQAPAIGAATFYLVTIHSLTVSGMATKSAFIASVYTSDTMLQLPPNLLLPGTTYVFSINARSQPNWNPTLPLVDTLPGGNATVVTGTVTP